MHLLENPFILHYCSHIKPWIESSRPNAHYFWEFARKTPFYEIIMKAEQLSAERERKIKKLKMKARKYKILQVLTLGLVRSFRLRKDRYRNEIRQIEEMM
jgi:lipopolysaccharide biosynthesis glycosyltransferase